MPSAITAGWHDEPFFRELHMGLHQAPRVALGVMYVSQAGGGAWPLGSRLCTMLLMLQ